MQNKNYIPCVQGFVKTLKFAFSEVFPPDVYKSERELLKDFQIKATMKRSDVIILLRLIDIFRGIVRRGYSKLLDLGYISSFEEFTQLETNLDNYIASGSKDDFRLV